MSSIEVLRISLDGLSQELTPRSNRTNEESPMNSYLARMNKRKQNGLSTPSPRSRTSYTEESPHFAKDAKEFTPSSRGKNSGMENLRSEFQTGHLISFGEGGQIYPVLNNLHHLAAQRAEASSVSEYSGLSSKGDPMKAISDSYQKDAKTNSHLFSFQQRNSPKQEPQKIGQHLREEYQADTIVEVEDDVKSSREEANQMKGYSKTSSLLESIEGDDENEDLDQFINKIPNYNKANSKAETTKYRSNDGNVDLIHHKASQNSNQGSYKDSKELSIRISSSMMPNYHQLFQTGKPIDLKQSPSTAKTAAKSSTGTDYPNTRRFNEDLHHPPYHQEEFQMKAIHSKEESFGNNFDSAQRALVNHIFENKPSQESTSSLARSSKRKDPYFSQFDSELQLNPKDVFLKQKPGADSLKPVMSLDGKRLLPTSSNGDDLNKKVQSTGVPAYEKVTRNSISNWFNEPVKSTEPISKTQREEGKLFKPPMYSNIELEKERNGPAKYGKSEVTSSLQFNPILKEKNFAPDLKGTNATPTGSSYLQRFQKKSQPLETKNPHDQLKKSQTFGIKTDEQEETSNKENYFHEPILDKFLVGMKRNDQPQKPIVVARGNTPLTSNPSYKPPHKPEQTKPIYGNPQQKKHNFSGKEQLEVPMRPPIQQHPAPEKIVRPIPLLENIMGKPPLQARDESPIRPQNKFSDSSHPDPRKFYDTKADQTKGYGDKSSRIQPSKGHENFSSGGYMTRSSDINQEELRKSMTKAQGLMQDDKAFHSHNPTGTNIIGKSLTNQPSYNVGRHPSSKDLTRKTTSGQGGCSIKIDIGQLSQKLMVSLKQHHEE